MSIAKNINKRSRAASIVVLPPPPALQQRQTGLLGLQQPPLNNICHHLINSLIDVNRILSARFFKIHLFGKTRTLCWAANSLAVSALTSRLFSRSSLLPTSARTSFSMLQFCSTLENQSSILMKELWQLIS